MNYSDLSIQPCGHTAVLPQRLPNTPLQLDLDSPAMAVITDFCREYPITVSPDLSIDDALNKMIRAGVRALLVIRENKVIGLISSYDIQGERPIRFLQSSNCLQDKCRHSDIHVSDIMTPCAELPAIPLNRLESAVVGDLVETFQRTDATHLLVTDIRPLDGAVIVRGIVSRTRLQRHLGEVLAARMRDRTLTT